MESGGGEEFRELSQYSVVPATVKLLGERYCRQHLVVLLGEAVEGSEEPLVLGMVDPGNGALIEEIEGGLGRRVTPVRLNAYEIERAIDLGHERTDRLERRGTLALKAVAALDFGPKTSVSETIGQLLGQAVAMGASDVHIESYEDDVDVRVRVDGVLRHLATPLSRANVGEAVSRVKVLAGMDIAEKRVAQDGRIRAKFEERSIDFRVSVVPGPHGEDAVLRILDSATPVVALEELGLGRDLLVVLTRIAQNPEGLLVVVGPTGSGKTTTLYALLQKLHTSERKVMTAEDPIEYRFPKVNQKQVSAQMSFADYARAFLRQNPDVILIGEVRDEETAEAAMRAAQTGHLVLSTLHTGDAVRTVSRLLNLGVDRNLVASTLVGSLAQRLVRRLCKACRHEAPPDELEQARFNVPASDTFFRAPGCPGCRGSGYRGRLGVFELFAPDDEISDLIAGAAPIHRIREVAVERGLVSLVDDALGKARKGETSLREILRVVPYRLIQRQRGLEPWPDTGA